MRASRVTTRSLTASTWPDLEALFGERGACGGCWCQTWRRSRADFNRGKGAGNKRALRAQARRGLPLGVLLYLDGAVAGWCSVSPREQFVTLERSRVWAPVDDAPVWSVSCFFVAKPFRRCGLSVELLKAAVAFARRHGARIVEGYPQDLRGKKLPDAFVWTGLVESYERAGFREAARRSPAKPIMRIRTTKR